MRISETASAALVATAFVFAVPHFAAAFEIKDLNADTPPAEAFSYGLNQYKSGDKLTAVEALNFAAQKGVAGAQWKLGRMYADGDGVAQDDIKAFQFFSEVAAHADDDEANTQSAPYVSNAFVRLGTYFRKGIPNTAVKADQSRARQLFYNAASMFRNADAQLNLAHMYYEGEGGARDLTSAAKWANLAAEKGSPDAKAFAIDVCLELAQEHLDGKNAEYSIREAAKWARQAADYGSVDGQALLGHILFEGDSIYRQPVEGLTLLTIALNRTHGSVRWIADMHEEALSAATDDEWNAARTRAQDWLAANPEQVAGAAPTPAPGVAASAGPPTN
jgi:TPR repeat protein